MLPNEPTRSYVGPTRGRAQVYLCSTHVHRSRNHNTKSQKNLVVIHPYDCTRPTNSISQHHPTTYTKATFLRLLGGGGIALLADSGNLGNMYKLEILKISHPRSEAHEYRCDIPTPITLL